MSLQAGTPLGKAVSVLVPVFRDLRVTRECLESLFRSNLPANASITVINDCSPDAELTAYCRQFAAEAGARLIENEQNLGFVKTANKAFKLEPDADTVLLNSDTVVSNDWLQRLQSCAYKHPTIGTVTPFSNNGTICSYPVFPISNKLPAHWTAAALDQAFHAVNTGAHCEIPTAVGFCMYIKRPCLNQTGYFDEESFGHGYGEECDFSLRASNLGWKHAIAADVFVYHEGGASFAAESTARKCHASKIMDELHPNYQQLVSDFLQSDPLYVFRRNVDAFRLRERPEESILAILEEHFLYSRVILDRAAETHRAMSNEREQRIILMALLEQCRNQFAGTDRALTEAQNVVNNLNKCLDDAQIYAEQLKQHISKMEKSRSWRYTAWLRRK